MGVFDFVRNAGAKVGIGKSTSEIEAEEAAGAAKEARVAAAKERRAEAKKSSELEAHVKKMGLDVDKLDVRFDNGTAYISGVAANQAELEKVVLTVGNVEGVGRVDENMTVKPAVDLAKLTADAKAEAVMLAAAAQTFHQVVSGDTLSAIAKKTLGNANRYPEIFEANKPMLTHPDKIYPGQMLRIPQD